jgi:hypothetical protein
MLNLPGFQTLLPFVGGEAQQWVRVSSAGPCSGKEQLLARQFADQKNPSPKAARESQLQQDEHRAFLPCFPSILES